MKQLPRALPRQPLLSRFCALAVVMISCSAGAMVSKAQEQSQPVPLPAPDSQLAPDVRQKGENGDGERSQEQHDDQRRGCPYVERELELIV